MSLRRYHRFWAVLRRRLSAIRPPGKERGVRRAGPRSDAYVSGRDTSLTPQKGLRPPAATSGDPLQPSVAALEDASTNLCNGGACSLAAHRPEPGTDWLPLAPTHPSAAALAYATTARPAGTDHPDPPLPPTGPPNPDALRHLNLGRPARAGLTREPPAFRPMRPFRRRNPPGVNDAPPKGWRSFRRRSVRCRRPPISFETGALPGLVAAAGEPLSSARRVPWEASQKSPEPTIIIAK